MHIDESFLIYNFIKKIYKIEGTIIDVGACDGDVLINYVNSDWKIYGFEPNKNIYNKLVDRVNNIKNTKEQIIKIENIAVSDINEKDLSFFLSDDSIGISTLKSFHESHKDSGFKTDTIRLDTYMNNNNINEVNYLKIDAEGFDLLVLKSYPWDKYLPDIIECEFEDNKTKENLNYTAKDMAEYLKNKGYHIVVSNWYPIKKYGTTHEWKDFTYYPCDIDSESWGNFICFKDINTYYDFKYFLDKVFKQIYVVGNGSSLKDFDFNFLKNKEWIGCTLGFRHWEELGFYPTHYVNVDLVVCEYQLEKIKDMIINNKCKTFLLTSHIIQFWNEILNYKNVYYIEQLKGMNGCPFKLLYDWCSGSSASCYGICMGANIINLLGMDCNYIEFIPECEKQPNGTLKIIKHPINNPNYYYPTYQRVGDLYNVPNTDRIHKKSWKDLNNLSKRINNNVVIKNYNTSDKLDDIFNRFDLNDIKS